MTLQPNRSDLNSASRSFKWKILLICLVGVLLASLMASIMKRSIPINHISPIKILTDYKDGVNICQFTDDGNLLVTLDIELNISCWNAKTWTLIRKIKMPKSVRSLALMPHTHLVAVGGKNTPISIVNLDTGKTEKYMHSRTDYASELSFSPDGANLVSGGVTDTTQVWNPDSGDLIRSLPDSIDATSLSFSPNGTMVARGGFDSKIDIFDTKSWKKIIAFTGHKDQITCIAFSPDGARLASVSYNSGIFVWDLAQHLELFHFTQLGLTPSAVVFSPDGKYLIGTGEYCLNIWDSKTGDLKAILIGPQGMIEDISISSDGGKIVACGSDGKVYIWAFPKLK